MSFAFWRQENAEASANHALFGKLPLRADFVRVNATIPVAREYDQLLAEAITDLSGDDGWQAAYDATSASLFAYRSRDKKFWLLGGQTPSHDQQRRRFPLVAGIARDLSEIGNNVPLIPLAYEVFYGSVLTHLENAIQNSVDAVSCRSFLEGFSGTDRKTGTDFDLPTALMSQFFASHDTNYLQDLLRTAYPHAELGQAMLNIAFYANFMRYFSQSITAQEIVLPLPNKLGTSSMIAAVWLALVGNLAGDPKRIAGFFFRDDFIVIALDMFSEQFSPLLPLTHSAKIRGLMLTSEHDTWCAHPIYPEISYAITRLMTESRVSLQSAFDCAKQIGNRLFYTE